jgi:hypothetical protein
MKEKIKLYTMKELLEPLTSEQKEEFKSLEASYRRGYLHGYSECIDNHHYVGAGIPDITYFFNKILTPWRYFKDKKSKNKVMVMPPEFDMEKYYNHEYRDEKDS